MQNKASPFDDPAAVANYAEGTLRKVPGLADLHRMATLLLAEQAPADAQILVVGAGGGLELKFMAEAQPRWQFTGVDPSSAMLDLAHHAVLPVAERVHLLKGTVDQAPAGPFDGAICLLVLHFLTRDERLHTLKEIRHRLTPHASIVIAHHSPAVENPERWMTLSAAFGDYSGFDLEKAAATGRMMTERLPLLAPAEEEALLREAGFVGIELFYTAFSFHGWVASTGLEKPSL